MIKQILLCAFNITEEDVSFAIGEKKFLNIVCHGVT